MNKRFEVHLPGVTKRLVDKGVIPKEYLAFRNDMSGDLLRSEYDLSDKDKLLHKGIDETGASGVNALPYSKGSYINFSKSENNLDTQSGWVCGFDRYKKLIRIVLDDGSVNADLVKKLIAKGACDIVLIEHGLRLGFVKIDEVDPECLVRDAAGMNAGTSG